MRRVVFRFLMAGLVPLAFAAGVQAQPDPQPTPGDALDERWVESSSHTEVPLERARLAAFLQNLDHEESKARLRDLLKQFVTNPATAQNPIAAWGQNSELQKELQRFLAGNQGVSPDNPLLLKALEILRKNPGAFNASGGTLPLNLRDLDAMQHQLPPHAQELLRQVLQRSQRPPNAETELAPSPFADAPHARQADGLRAAASAARDPEHWLEQWLIKQVKRIDTNHEVFKSPAVQDMFKEVTRLTRADRLDHLPKSAALGNIGRSVIDLAKRWKLDEAVSRLRLPPLRNLPVPAARGWHLPRLRLPSVSLGGPGGPGSSAPAGSSSSGSTATLLLAAALAGLIWYALARHRRTLSRARPPQALLAEWPVPPDSVSTREDVIRAFEYLSLVQLGLEARTRHHRALAEGLGGSQAARQHAAAQLAGLYEQARYAPGDEPLPAPDLDAARRSLTLLAGKALA